MAKEAQMRKVILTINNPSEAGYTLDVVDKLVQELKPQYYCRCLERGKEGTEHCHIGIFRPSPIRFSTLKRRFETAHIDKGYGSMREIRDYVMKGGKWIDTEKADTSIPGTFAEFGALPTEQEETAGKMALLVEAIHSGKSTAEIVKEFPDFALRVPQIEAFRETVRREEVSGKMRNVDVSYLYGATGTGKTYSIFAAHDPKDVCRVTSYPNSGIRFDAYHGQKVLVFEEFASQIPLSDMLNYLDRYPLDLPARYSDRPACYDTVYITSNLPLNKQYVNERENCPERYKAFQRRINHVIEFRPDRTQKILK